ELESIRNLLLSFNEPYTIFGDFNALISPLERERGNPPSVRSLADFNAFISDLSLISLDFSGPPFTWSKKCLTGEDKIKSRLDRFLTSRNWIDAWPKSSVTHLKARGSDHLPILLQEVPISSPTRRLFRFNNRWMELKEVRDIVISVWNLHVSGSLMFKVAEKLKIIRHRLFSLMKSGMTNSGEKIKNIEKAIDEALALEEQNWELISNLEADLAIEVHKETMYWKARSRCNWIDFGDKNTKVFHQSVAYQRKENTVKTLLYEMISHNHQNSVWERLQLHFIRIFFLHPTPLLESIISSHPALKGEKSQMK
ncbi:hypothetical protein LINPERHAP1_LOCUS8141, partial [Linum perenne]